MQFQVWLHGKKVFDSGIMDKYTRAKQFEVDISGCEMLELRSLDGDDGLNGDRGDWAAARIVK